MSYGAFFLLPVCDGLSFTNAFEFILDPMSSPLPPHLQHPNRSRLWPLTGGVPPLGVCVVPT